MKKIKISLLYFILCISLTHAQNDTTQCTCTGDCIGPLYSNLLKHFIEFEDFENSLEWKLNGGKELYESIFYRNLMGDNNRQMAGYHLKIVSYDQIRLVHPQDYYTINILPCQIDKIFHILPIQVTYRHDTKRYLPKFDFINFDHSPKSYYTVLKARSGIDDVEFLTTAIESGPLHWKGKGKALSKKEFIAKLTKKHKVEITKNESYSSENRTKYYLLQLKKQKVDLSKIALEHFILYGKKLKKADAKIEKRLDYLFGKWLGNISYITIRRSILNPTIEANIQAPNINMEFSPNIIREWNLLKNSPKLDSTKEPIGTKVLCSIYDLKYSSISGINTYVYETCMPTSEITGTGILFNIDEARIATNKRKMTPVLNYKLYPQCIIDSIKQKDKYVYQYSTLLTEFSGLDIPFATFSIPYKGSVLKMEGADILLNNKVLMGSIILDPEEQISSIGLDSIITIKDNNNNSLKIELKTLIKSLKKKGLKNLAFEKKDKRITFLIKK